MAIKAKAVYHSVTACYVARRDHYTLDECCGQVQPKSTPQLRVNSNGRKARACGEIALPRPNDPSRRVLKSGRVRITCK